MNKRRIVSLVAAAALLLGMTQTTLGVTESDYREQLDTLNSRYDALEKQQKAIQQEINKAKNEKDKAIALKKQLDNQVYGVRQQIDLLTDKIALLESNIAQKETELADQKLGIDDNMALLKKRLRVMYTTGNASVLGLVLGAEDFTEFLTRTQVASRVVQHDHALIETMQTELAVLSKIKDEIELDKADLESANTQMAQRKGQLDTQVAAAQNQIQDMSKLQQDYAANKAKIDAEMKAAEAEIDAIYDQFESSGEYDGGQMNWPVAGFSYISSTYGWRFNHTDFHTGVDVAGRNAAGQGIYGQPIRAAADGRVIFATTNYVPGKNYGIYVIVDHGGGISTLYGHTSGLAVKTGQEVSRGQTLGYVGSTGWSTGPHLHFEVRINGKYTDPRPYLGLK